MRATCVIDGQGGDLFVDQFGWRYLRCPACGFQWVENMPSAQGLAELYSPSSGYQRHHARQEIARDNPHYRMLLKLVEEDRAAPARVLDVGCSAGDVAVPLLERGYQVDGVEPNETTASVALRRGIRIVGSDIESVPFGQLYDCIVASEVIEHVADPEVFVAHLARLVAPGGSVILSTPNTSSWLSRISSYIVPSLSLPVSYLTAPYHLTYFNPATLHALLKRHGFILQRVYFRSGPPLRYELGNLHLWGAWRRSRRFRDFGRLVVGFSLTTMIWVVDRIGTTLGAQGFQMYMVVSTRHGSGPVFDQRKGGSVVVARFLLGGVIVTALQAGLLYVLSDIIGVWYLMASQLSFIITFLISFLLYRDWVFPQRGSDVRRQFFNYTTLTFVNFLTNGFLMYAFVQLIQLNPIPAQVVVKAVIAGFNFIAYRSIVFKT